MNKNLVSRLPWWTNPPLLVAFLITPTFILSSYAAGDIMYMFGSPNMLSNFIILVGTINLVSLIFGSYAGSFVANYMPLARRIDARNYQRYLLITLFLVFLANLIYIGGTLTRPDLVIAVFKGEDRAIYAIDAYLSRIVGITSLTQLCLISSSMYAFHFLYFKSPPPRLCRRLFWATLLVLIPLRVILGRERLALLEYIIPALLPLVLMGYFKRRTLLFGPLIGFSLIFGLFSIGEYTKTWFYYESQYSSFLQFVSLRFLGYLATSANNAAGTYEYYGVSGEPLLTLSWIKKLPWITDGGPTPLGQYLLNVGNVEFNNPSGILATTVDFGIWGGLLYNFLFGILSGISFKSFAAGRIFGVLFFPMIYMAYITIFAIVYIGDARVLFPILWGVFCLFAITRPNRTERTSVSHIRDLKYD